MWVAILAVFYQPLVMGLGPRVGPAVQELEIGSWPGSRSARGFMLQVASKPVGAEVWVDGALRAQTPAIANIACRNGDAVNILLRHDGYRDAENVVECREGGSLSVRLRLER